MPIVNDLYCMKQTIRFTIGLRNDNRPSPVYVCIVAFDDDLLAVPPIAIVVFDVYMRVFPFDDDLLALSAGV